MINHIKTLCFLVFIVCVSGCSMLNTALSLGAAYGIYQLTK